MTNRRQRHSEATDRNAHFRLLFASNPLPMWVYDMTTLAFLEVNDAAIAQYGYSRDEFLGMRITDIRPPEDVARVKEAAAAAARDGAHVVRHAGTWRHRLRGGQVRDVDIASHAIRFAGRSAALVVATDVTDLKEAQAALGKYAERLRILHEIDAAIIAA
ncbi:MAG: PAS domain S-box protein, partial [Candidatus Rokuibacteriota bacterium]